jgi:hypothetical protein
MCSVKLPKITSITIEFLNRMMTADDYVADVGDDDQSIIRNSFVHQEY